MLIAPVLISLLTGASAANGYVLWSSRGRVHNSVRQVPPHDVALVLGCAPHRADGRVNAYFQARIEAAAALYHAGKVRRVLVSGDGAESGRGDETEAMQRALEALGVRCGDILVDAQGHRTWASVSRARSRFGLTSLVVVSQAFHTPRAVFLARQCNIDAHALNAASPAATSRPQLRLQARECVARVRAVWDVNTTRIRSSQQNA